MVFPLPSNLDSRCTAGTSQEWVLYSVPIQLGTQETTTVCFARKVAIVLTFLKLLNYTHVGDCWWTLITSQFQTSGTSCSSFSTLASVWSSSGSLDLHIESAIDGEL
jgi:hypothetical protein